MATLSVAVRYFFRMIEQKIAPPAPGNGAGARKRTRDMRPVGEVEGSKWLGARFVGRLAEYRDRRKNDGDACSEA